MNTMKNIISKFLLLTIVVSFSACNKSEPEVVAEKFLANFYARDYAEAKTVATTKAKDILIIVEKISSNLEDSVDINVEDIKVDIVNSIIDGDKAVVTYTLSSDATERHLNMVKENGEWLANFTKEDNLKEIEQEIDGNHQEN